MDILVHVLLVWWLITMQLEHLQRHYSQTIVACSDYSGLLDPIIQPPWSCLPLTYCCCHVEQHLHHIKDFPSKLPSSFYLATTTCTVQVDLGDCNCVYKQVPYIPITTYTITKDIVKLWITLYPMGCTVLATSPNVTCTPTLYPLRGKD